MVGLSLKIGPPVKNKFLNYLFQSVHLWQELSAIGVKQNNVYRHRGLSLFLSTQFPTCLQITESVLLMTISRGNTGVIVKSGSGCLQLIFISLPCTHFLPRRQKSLQLSVLGNPRLLIFWRLASCTTKILSDIIQGPAKISDSSGTYYLKPAFIRVSLMMWSSGLEKGCGRFICTSPHGFRVLFCTIHSAVLLFPELKITELKANRIRFVIEISRLSILGFSALLPCFAPMRLKILSILLSTVCPGPWLY